MKSYEEVAKSVFEKSEAYFIKRWHKLRRIKIAVSTLSCVCLTAVAVFAVLHSGILTDHPENGEAFSEGQYTSDSENAGNIPAEPDNTNDIITIPDDESTYDYVWQWKTPGEILSSDVIDSEMSSGAYTDPFLVYDGALYTLYAPTDEKSDRYYASTGYNAYYTEFFPREAYVVKDEPDLIAVRLDSNIWEYKKLFDCGFDIGGESFKIAYSAIIHSCASWDIEFGWLNVVLQTEDFTVYEVSGEDLLHSDIKEYIVDLSPALKKTLPELINDEAECGDAWWMALPGSVEKERFRVDASEGEPSLPVNTLSGVTPDNTGRILKEAEAVSDDIYMSVFVPAENGSEIYSLSDGTVKMIGSNGTLGNTVVVMTSDRKLIMHCHLSEILVDVCDTVTEGQVIGLAGTTGDTAYPGASYIVDNRYRLWIEALNLLEQVPNHPSTSPDVLIDLTPKDTDQILVSAQELSVAIVTCAHVSAEYGSEVYSLVDGTVVMAGYDLVQGLTVEVETSDRRHVKHCHLSEVLVEIGDAVAQDQVIGLAGDTGSTYDTTAGYIVY